MKRVRIFIFCFHKDYQKGRHKVSINKAFIHSLSDPSLCPLDSLPFFLAPFLFSASSLPPSLPSFQIILFQSLISAGCYRYKGFPCGSAGKESACNVEDLGLIPGLGRSPGEGKGYPFQYSCLENSMDYTVHGVTKSQTRLSDFHISQSSWYQNQTKTLQKERKRKLQANIFDENRFKSLTK